MGDRVITGKTKLCGIIGDPIEHSMSPVMHNAAFSRLGLDFCYVPFRVRPADLAPAVAAVRALNIRGVNVTIPHKVTTIPFLDSLDPLAEKIGAVNTVVNDGGALRGYNTDAEGFLRALAENGVTPEGKNVVVIGAGGASRAISFVLAEQKADLVILNRREELDWAVGLAASLRRSFGREVRALELTGDNLKPALDSADILVNATSVGMTPHADRTAVPARFLKPSLVVFDAVYNPIETRLLREAKSAGAKTISGLDMLVWQGALAFEKWTGVPAPAEVMKEEALKVLRVHRV